jgi:7-cyano-7-deazaguanine tRNA-ribosyltransferase
MENGSFEITDKDIMGRIGKLKTPHGVIETPTLFPVINPNIDFIHPRELRRLGAQGVITNAYIIYRTNNLREKAVKRGIHDLIGFQGPVMTDSGSYQLSVYGDVEITNSEIIEFQNIIQADILTPLDIPTPPYVTRAEAEEDLKTTSSRLKEAKKIHSEIGDDRLLVGPIQGSTYCDLRTNSVKTAESIGFDIYAIGGMVPLMDNYEYSTVTEIIIEVKKCLSPSRPVHLFGAGHPMMFAVAVALGCDIFDSAAYALYAKNDRYLTPQGTLKLNEIHYFPCNCEVCSSYTPQELRTSEDKERLLAIHNLHTTFTELDTIKQAIKSNTLFELVEMRIRSHPSLLEGWRNAIFKKDFASTIERFDPSYKRTFFYTGIESCYRPAVIRHQKKTLELKIENREVSISFSPHIDAEFYFKPPFGIYHRALKESYPVGHAEIPSIIEAETIETGLKNLKEFIEKNKHVRITLICDTRWKNLISEFFDQIPTNVSFREVK